MVTLQTAAARLAWSFQGGSPRPPHIRMSDSSFPDTRWTLLRRVREGTEAESRTALETLCRAYWQPLYGVARRKQLAEHDAQDAVQGFFESMLRRETFAAAEESSGKLRQILLCAFDRYCGQQWLRSQRLKRGAGAVHVEFDGIGLAEERYLASTGEDTSIETHYNREWATAVMERGLEALRADYLRRGWQQRYEHLVRSLLQTGQKSNLEQLAKGMDITPGALRVMLHRMRGHYRDKIERELALTLDTEDPALIRAEMAELFKAFA